jgi:hypothetical protein
MLRCGVESAVRVKQSVSDSWFMMVGVQDWFGADSVSDWRDAFSVICRIELVPGRAPAGPTDVT